ncbi:elastase-1-like isoform X1 [Betta splendens]|uniref:Elastase-1-like isoform X1 n=1 Tax=Betta splendens TaxID=158456 RepID=A0A9W2XSL0_BETSP|nr:elastase-1-like isoform X1 [Betta splendens]
MWRGVLISVPLRLSAGAAGASEQLHGAPRCCWKSGGRRRGGVSHLVALAGVAPVQQRRVLSAFLWRNPDQQRLGDDCSSVCVQLLHSHSSFRVVLGDLILHSGHGTEQYRNVAKFYVHPEWNFNSISSGFDIALLRLSSEASVTAYVKPAPLPPFGEVLPHGSPCYITGYGSTSTGGGGVSRMRQAHLPVVDHQTCTSSGWWGSTVKTTMICAGGGAASGCDGDFGGPLSCKVNNVWYVHGVASFVSGMGCNAPQKPTVFTRVSAYITWINTVMSNP